MPLNLAALTTLSREIALAVEAEATESILLPSQDLVPVDTQALRDSGRVVTATDVVYVTYGRDDDQGINGAPTNAYAVRQHEDVELQHPNGGQAHFLSGAMDAAQSGFAARVARRVRP